MWSIIGILILLVMLFGFNYVINTGTAKEMRNEDIFYDMSLTMMMIVQISFGIIILISGILYSNSLVLYGSISLLMALPCATTLKNKEGSMLFIKKFIKEKYIRNKEESNEQHRC